MNKEVLKNLLTMMRSSDKDNHYMAMQAIVNLGDPSTVIENYKEELLFLWLYGKPHLEDWALVDARVTRLFRDLVNKNRPKGVGMVYKQDLKYKERWLGHMIGPNARIKKPWVAELMIEEIINEKKRIFNALDFKYKEIQVNIIQ
jgi:hypothetical protein